MLAACDTSEPKRVVQVVSPMRQCAVCCLQLPATILPVVWPDMHRVGAFDHEGATMDTYTGSARERYKVHDVGLSMGGPVGAGVRALSVRVVGALACALGKPQHKHI